MPLSVAPPSEKTDTYDFAYKRVSGFSEQGDRVSFIASVVELKPIGADKLELFFYKEFLREVIRFIRKDTLSPDKTVISLNNNIRAIVYSPDSFLSKLRR